MNGEDLSAVIRKIIENPEFAGMVSELRGDGNIEGASQEMLSKLPDVMAMVQPMLEATESEEPKNNEEVKEVKGKKRETNSALLPGRYDKTKAEKLMYALKPYLNSSRCEMIDKCITVMQLGDVMNVFGGLEGLIKRE